MTRTVNIFVTMLLLSLGAVNAFAQNYAKKLKNAQGIEVVYESSFKGRVSPEKTLMTICGNEAEVKSFPHETDNRKQLFPEIKTYEDYATNTSYRLAKLPKGETISTKNPFDTSKEMSFVRDDEFLGLPCKVVRTIINSNTIEIWYTTALPFKGTPQPGVGVPDGLVLKVVRNGDSVQQATEIKALKTSIALFPENWGEEMDSWDFQYALNHSGVITVPVFDQQRINFSGAKMPEELKDGEVYNVGGGTIILKKVALPDSADIANRSIFAEVVQYSDGDAYDRTGSIFVIPTGKKQSFLDAIKDLKTVPAFESDSTNYHGLISTVDYDVPLELMRFFTGFGVRAYNKNKVKGQEWVDSVIYKTEISDLSEHLSGDQWIGAYIGNWDGNGHKLSLNLNYYPNSLQKSYKSIPLFNTVNYLEQAGQPYPIFMLNDSLTVEFTLDEDIENAYLNYTTTGHGGWGNGDEFNKKSNTIYLDGKQIFTFIPWREDCGTYRNWNPCSGNFSNGLSSSDLSRSNWCPGTVTNPEYVYLGNLKAGKHRISVKIPQGAPEGGSNSYWCISGTLLY